MSEQSAWPELPVEKWLPTRDTLMLWLQVVGKIRIARAPLLNHWWNAPLYLTARGLTTSLIPGERGSMFSIDLDLLDHRLDILTTDGDRRSMDLTPRSVKDFHAALTSQLDSLGLTTEIWPVPVELSGAIPFAEDDTHDAYDAEAVTAWWRTMVQAHRVFEIFRTRFLGKSGPTQLFWGALDLETTRYSGRPAPEYTRPVPNVGPHVMREAYSHEVSSAGYWPGAEGEGIFYAFVYPEPDGYRSRPAGPADARWDENMGEFVLPYTAVRTAVDPDAVLLQFLQATYVAAAETAGWDRAALERPG